MRASSTSDAGAWVGAKSAAHLGSRSAHIDALSAQSTLIQLRARTLSFLQREHAPGRRPVACVLRVAGGL